MDGSLHHTAMMPMNVEQIVKKAQDFDYNPLIPLRYWLRTADTLLKEARIYEREGNDQQAYLLLFRHAQLVLGYLSTHPDAQQHENRLTLAESKGAVKTNLAKLEVLKPRINKRYEKYEAIIRERNVRRGASAKERGEIYSHQSTESDTSSFPSSKDGDPAVAGASRPLAAEDNKDLAVQLAHKEIKRRQTARRATRQAGISEDEEHERRTAGVWADWEDALARDSQVRDDSDLSGNLWETRRRMDGSWSAGPRNRTHESGSELKGRRSPGDITYRYPSVPQKSAYEMWTPTPLPPSAVKQASAKGILNHSLPPERPSKTSLFANEPSSANSRLSLPSEEYPPRPEKSPQVEPVSRSATATPTQTDIQPSTFTFKPSAYLENGAPLRTIFLPPDLRSRFLSLAAPNTRANLETCGILCGTLISNALFVSKLVIPEQESTSDTCETVNESALFDYCDSEDLMVLGWIHTHPTQTCFMSSRDLHTHCGYQIMMPESIAIVCAPSKDPSWGVFRLTDPPGMKAVRNCQQPGLFHPHAEGNIYTDALRPGHVFEAKGLEFEVMDLR
ncbi:MAG: hypothetical protein M1827_000083 [Pycnora praestabilis]|nr:MAG: hypothetical protein M1827_000083 [Pycnora praestabilis]